LALLIAAYHLLITDRNLRLTRPLKPWTLIPGPFVLLLLGYVFEIYEVAGRERLRTLLWVGCVCFLSFCVMFALAKLLRINQTTMIAALIYFVILTILMFGWRIAARRLLFRTRHRIRSRVLFLGWDAASAELVQSMRFRDFKILGALSLPDTRDARDDSIPLLGSLEHLEQIMDAESIDLIITSIDAKLPLAVMKHLYRWRYRGVSVYDSAFFYELLTGKVAIASYLRDEATPFLNLDAFVHPFFRNVKRLIDFGGALLGLILLSPLFLLILLIQKITSPGPVFFVQERVGFQESPIRVLKFRTMIPDAEKHTGPVGAVENDTRVTSLGKWLRKFRLDELPQLISIFNGDMSFVGPRPIRRFFVNQIEERMPFYSLRYSVKPGLTGWAQVHGSAGGDMEGHIDKFQYDLYYINHASVYLDLLILLKTLQTLIRRPGF
jgi:exopolysaccharide biosynthesis polyprenyl glycosylphosphotransferase